MTAWLAASAAFYLGAAVLLGWLLAPGPLRRRAPARHLGFALLWLVGGVGLWAAMVVTGLAMPVEALALAAPAALAVAWLSAWPVLGVGGGRGLVVAGLQFAGVAAVAAIEAAWLRLRAMTPIPAVEG